MVFFFWCYLGFGCSALLVGVGREMERKEGVGGYRLLVGVGRRSGGEGGVVVPSDRGKSWCSG